MVILAELLGGGTAPRTPRSSENRRKSGFSTKLRFSMKLFLVLSDGGVHECFGSFFMET